MNNLLLKKITIYITVDEDSIDSYFNPHDPSPLYKRQLSHDFDNYFMSSIVAIKRHTVLRYKLVCNNESDKQYIEPLVHAIRRHFSLKKSIKEAEFKKFKRRNRLLLVFSFIIVMIFQGLVPMIFATEHRIHSAFSNALDVFSWVILWKPIERLIFYYNPFLKEISILDKLTNAPIVMIVENRELAAIEHAA